MGRQPTEVQVLDGAARLQTEITLRMMGRCGMAEAEWNTASRTAGRHRPTSDICKMLGKAPLNPARNICLALLSSFKCFCNGLYHVANSAGARPSSRATRKWPYQEAFVGGVFDDLGHIALPVGDSLRGVSFRRGISIVNTNTEAVVEQPAIFEKSWCVASGPSSRNMTSTRPPCEAPMLVFPTTP